MTHLLPIFTIRFTDIVPQDKQLDILQNAIASFASNTFADALVKKGLHHDLFHNHEDDGKPIARIPLIMFYSSGADKQPKCFCITGIGKGAKALEMLAGALPPTAAIKGQEFSFRNTEKTVQQHPFMVLDHLQFYGLYRWIGFTGDNYLWWLENPLLVDRVVMAEKLIGDHLANFLESIGAPIARPQIKIFIERINATEIFEIPVDGGTYIRKELGISLSFMSNILLPTGMGIGAYTAKGYGQVRTLPISPERKNTLVELAKKVL